MDLAEKTSLNLPYLLIDGLSNWQKTGVYDRVLSGLLKRAAQEGKINLSTRLVDGSFSP